MSFFRRWWWRRKLREDLERELDEDEPPAGDVGPTRDESTYKWKMSPEALRALNEGVDQRQLDEMGITEGSGAAPVRSSFAFDRVTSDFGPGASAAQEELRNLVAQEEEAHVRRSRSRSLERWDSAAMQASPGSEAGSEDLASISTTSDDSPAGETQYWLRKKQEGGKPEGPSASPAGRTSSPEDEDAQRSLRVQVASFAELENLTRQNREALEAIGRLVGQPTTGSSSFGNEFANTDNLRELNRLVAIGKDLHEITVRHKEDKDIQRKELALPPGSKAYYIVVKTGLCNAYLAASVVSSSLVSSSKTGGMAKAGQALNVLSSAVPVVGGLASFTAAALKAGDRHIQTRRVVKITEMATGVTECGALARTLALWLADGHAAGTVPTTRKVEATRPPTAADVDGGAGGCGWNQTSGALPDGADEEAVMEWFTDKVANDEADNDPSKGTRKEKAGRKLGKRHLRKLLVEIGQGCLRGTNTAEEKVERLLRLIVPGAKVMPAASPSAPEELAVPSPVSAPPHDGSLNREAEFAARLEALEARNRRLERLVGEVDAVKKRVPKPQKGPNGGVDTGGGQILDQKQEVKTKEDFWQAAENTEAAAAADRMVTHAQLLEFAALQDERHREHDDRHREHDANHSRLQRELDRK